MLHGTRTGPEIRSYPAVSGEPRLSRRFGHSESTLTISMLNVNIVFDVQTLYKTYMLPFFPLFHFNSFNSTQFSQTCANFPRYFTQCQQISLTSSLLLIFHSISPTSANFRPPFKSVSRISTHFYPISRNFIQFQSLSLQFTKLLLTVT